MFTRSVPSRRRPLVPVIAAAVALAAACVPPTPADPAWRRVTPNAEGRYTSPIVSPDGEVVVSAIAGTDRISVDRVDPPGHSTFTIPGALTDPVLSGISETGEFVYLAEVELVNYRTVTHRVATADGSDVAVGSFTPSSEIAGDGRSAAKVTTDCTVKPCVNELITWSEASGTSRRAVDVDGSAAFSRIRSDGTAVFVVTTYSAAAARFWSVDIASGVVSEVPIALPGGPLYPWPTWISRDFTEFRFGVVSDPTGSAVGQWSVRPGEPAVRDETCPSATFSANGRYCLSSTYEWAPYRRVMTVTDRATGAVTFRVADDSDDLGGKIDGGWSISDDGTVPFGFHSRLEPDWPVYLGGVGAG